MLIRKTKKKSLTIQTRYHLQKYIARKLIDGENKFCVQYDTVVYSMISSRLLAKHFLTVTRHGIMGNLCRSLQNIVSMY